MCFMELISVDYENTKYLINRFVLQELGQVVEDSLTVKNKWELLTGDDGVGFKLYISVILHSTATYNNVSELILVLKENGSNLPP